MVDQIDSQQPGSTEVTGTTESPVDVVKGRLRAYVEGEKLGSTRSDAYLDALDRFLLESTVAPSPEWEARFQNEDLIMGESIRQRTNGVPGYSFAYTEVRCMAIELEEELKNQFGVPTRTETLSPENPQEKKARLEASRVIRELKYDQIERFQNDPQGTSTESQTPPPPTTPQA